MIEVSHWKGVPADKWRWPNFTPEEMACKGDNSLKLDEQFMDRLQALRDAVGFPLTVSSGYRSPSYNAKVADTGNDGPHTTGHAVDLLVSGDKAVQVMRVALQIGFTGFGLSQKGDHGKRFIHLDDLPPPAPRPALWTY